MLCIDRLIERIIKLKAPIVVGLDPILNNIPDIYKRPYKADTDSIETIGNIFFDFNKDVIDVIADYVPAVKPQIAYYEAYGIPGLIAFQKTVDYAKKKGLIVIEDGKRNDIGSSAQAYANGHIGRSSNLSNDKKLPLFDVDYITVNPYLGSDGIDPFIKNCDEYNKGIFILVKTSNDSSGEYQDRQLQNGKTLYQLVAEYVDEQSWNRKGKYGYSSVGAVVGATYPEQATLLRSVMKSSFFLVPGYGQQGGSARDVLPCFNDDGLGALINSARGILYAYLDEYTEADVSKAQFCKKVESAVKNMRDDIVSCLRENCCGIRY